MGKTSRLPKDCQALKAARLVPTAWLLGGAGFFVACSNQSHPFPVVETVEPNVLSAVGRVPLVISGRNFHLGIHADLGEKEPRVIAEFTTVTTHMGSGEALAHEGTSWVDTTTLAVTVPAGIQVGVYSLRVDGPLGRSNTLEAAFVVCPDVDGDGRCSARNGCVHECDDCTDRDGDGWGQGGTDQSGCPEAGDDCNDSDPTINGGAVDVPEDGIDQDCNGGDARRCYVDADMDGYGTDLGTTVVADDGTCDTGDNESAISTDCDDAVATGFSINPAATEICDGVDNNCADGIDEPGAPDGTLYYADSDGDGYGDADAPGTRYCSDPGAGHSANNTDCDDQSGTGFPIHPFATEICEGLDNNCDGLTDEGCPCTHGSGLGVCAGDSGTLDGSGGCDPPSSYEAPTTSESQCTGEDNDCDGTQDEGCSCDYLGSTNGVCADGGTRDATGSCTIPPPTYESAEATCDDVADNDCDRTRDDEDLDCWVEPDCGKRMRVGLDNRGQLEALVDFPLLVTLPNTWPGHPVARANGLGIRFVDSEGVALLDHEIESWSPAGTSYVWVQVPQIDPDTDSDRIWLYYGCGADAPQNPTGVWSDAFAGVWHLHQGFADATVHGTHGTNAGSTDTDGAIARARGFSGGERVHMPTAPVLNIHGDVTISVWARYSSLNAGTFANSLFGNAGFADTEEVNYHYYLGIVGDRTLTSFWEFGPGNNIDPSSTEVAPVASDAYHFYALTRDSTNKIARFYVDGAKLGDDVSYANNPTGGQDATLGIGHDPCCAQGYFQGGIDEVRVESVERSVFWIKAQHLSMTGQMVALGNEEP